MPMDTKERDYFMKCHDNINLQRFHLGDYKEQTEIMFIELEKEVD